MSPEEFHNEFAPEFTQPPTSSPYGNNPHQPVKTGLTPRGKAATAVITAVIAGSALLGYNHYTAEQAAQANKAQELALKQQELRLQELQMLGQQAAANQKTATAQATAFQAKVDACVKANKTLVIGKQLGATLRSVVDDCKAQYEASATSGDDMLTAATAASTGGSEGGLNTGVLIGAGVLAAGLVIVVKKNTKSNPA